ncbi:twin-arginine translocase TatA/TatE family subunit [Candidatus Roizmanbacteria bacterium]|nr:twin-arginine translocase TatA/TatE family subunit [Candidatus Roizmanbacteria bacterium]
MFDFIKNISPTELVIIVLILIVFFGGRLVTSLAKNSGETVKEIKKIKNEFTKAIGIDDGKSKKN